MLPARARKLGGTNLRDAAAIAARHYHSLDRADAPSTLSLVSVEFEGDVVVPTDAEDAGLTPRELSVLHHLFAGHSPDREIAAQLFISRRTASKHVEAILSKLGVRSRGAAVAKARRLGLAPATDRAD